MNSISRQARKGMQSFAKGEIGTIPPFFLRSTGRVETGKLGVAINLFAWLRKRKGADSNPHFSVAPEIIRVMSPCKMWEAVVTEHTGTNRALYLLKAGSPIHGSSWQVMFVHSLSTMPSIQWLDSGDLVCTQACAEQIVNTNWNVLQAGENSIHLSLNQ